MASFQPPVMLGSGPSAAMAIPYPDDRVMVDYIFVNNTRLEFQQRTRVLDKEPTRLEDLPIWDTSMFDTLENIDPRPEMTLKPVAMFPDPFRQGKNKLVLCQFFHRDKVPVINTRYPFEQFMSDPTIRALEPWIGWEQEYFIYNCEDMPIGWSTRKDFINNWRHTSLMTGDFSGFERSFTEYHARACLYAGIKLFGISREECCGQWEFQIGPGDCLTMCDHLVVARYLMYRVAEIFGCKITFKAKGAPGTFWCSGNHLNYSTNQMRAENGIVHIREAAQKVATVSLPALLKYYDRNNGEDNKERLIGDHFVPSGSVTSIGEADKFASLRIPEGVVLAGKGYLEERRPIGDNDPYLTVLGFLRALYKPEQL